MTGGLPFVWAWPFALGPMIVAKANKTKKNLIKTFMGYSPLSFLIENSLIP